MQYKFIPRILSGAAELEIDFYRDLYELGVWWALLSSYDRETRARRVLERSLYNVEGFREAFDREAAKGGEFFDVIDRILHKADRACKEWSQYEYEENKRDRAEDNRTARPQTGGLFRPHSLHLGKVVQMTPNDQKEKEVWEAEQASANLPMSGQDEDDIERMRKEFDEVFAF